MLFDNSEIKELTEILDIGTFMDREGIDYRPTMGSRGPQYNVKTCPVCGSSSWKVYINQESGLGNCFSGGHPAGKNFSKYSFIQAVMGEGTPAIAVIENMRRLAKDQGWRRRRTTTVETISNKDSPLMPESFELPIKGQNLSYLANRGIDVATARYFGLRYCHVGHFAYLLKDGEPRQQDYSRRIIIPIYDLTGVLVGFQGRDITGNAEKKYLFPPGYGSTGEHLYNGQNVVGTKRVIVGEGVFDVIATKIACDVDPSLRDIVPVGTFGKHLSHGTPTSQLAKFVTLKGRGVEEVTLMWDGEIEATDDAIVAGMILRSVGLRVRIAMLPALKDPNEVPGEVVRDAYYKAIPLDALSAAQIKMLRRKMNASAA